LVLFFGFGKPKVFDLVGHLKVKRFNLVAVVCRNEGFLNFLEVQLALQNFNYFLNLSFKAHVQNAVALLKYEALQFFIKEAFSIFQMIENTTGRRTQDIYSLSQLGLLLLWVFAAVQSSAAYPN